MAIKTHNSRLITHSPDVSAVVIAKNEEEKIGDCLRSLSWAKEVLVIDNGSTDKTSDIAKRLGAQVISSPSGAYKESRDRGMKEAKGKWVLYVDADERVTPQLKEEIVTLTNHSLPTNNSYGAFAISRLNVILGREMRHGGWWPDYVVHFIKRSAFRGWKGELHEEPVFIDKLGYFKNHLMHIKHNNLSDMVSKTNTWSLVEAKLMFDGHHPQMTLPRFASAVAREFWLRMIKNLAFLDGTPGVIYALYQVYSKFISYAKLWELQLKKL